MDDLRLNEVPVAQTGMLIRRPAHEVFEAFVDPDITTRFWFTASTGRLEPGTEVQWEWGMYGVSVPVMVRAVEPHERILIEWPGERGPTTVEWTFTSFDDGTTFVQITNSGFSGAADEIVEQVTDSSQGFALVLAGLKALLEHDVRLNVVADRYPESVEDA